MGKPANRKCIKIKPREWHKKGVDDLKRLETRVSTMHVKISLHLSADF